MKTFTEPVPVPLLLALTSPIDDSGSCQALTDQADDSGSCLYPSGPADGPRYVQANGAAKTVFFDIETTGLSPRQSHLYLIGAIGCVDGQWVLRQWFAEKPSEEPILLRAFSDFLQETGAEALCHYNGDTFDLPYLRRKSTFHDLPCPVDSLQSLDLYRRLRPFRHMLGTSSFRQKDAERCIGLCRDDEMSGGELISVYQDYLRTASADGLRLLLLHNHDDLLGLTGILPLLTLERLFEGDFQDDLPAFREEPFHAASPDSSCEKDNRDGLLSGCGNPSPDEGLKSQTSECGDSSFSASMSAFIQIRLRQPLPVSLQLSSSLCRLNGEKGNVVCTLQIPCLQGTLRHFFSDYGNYYYLPAEDQAIHKSVAAYVDRKHRVKATAANCCQKMTGIFLPQPSEIIKPSFRSSYADKRFWLQHTNAALEETEPRHAYVLAMLQTLRR